jgi:hypothetical protein
MLQDTAIALAGSPVPEWLVQFGGRVEHALAPARELVRPVLSSWWTLGIRVALNLVSLGVLRWNLRERNRNLPSIWKQGFRSASHCYSGCGIGEVIGITAATVILSFPILWVVVTTFALAYLFGFAFTVGPLMQEGVGFGEAVEDALWSETPSITVMEIAAIGTDLLLAGGAGWANPLFWTALFFSLTIGFVAAYPVNAALIAVGVKEGMGNPAEMDGGRRAGASAD